MSIYFTQSSPGMVGVFIQNKISCWTFFNSTYLRHLSGSKVVMERKRKGKLWFSDSVYLFLAFCEAKFLFFFLFVFYYHSVFSFFFFHILNKQLSLFPLHRINKQNVRVWQMKRRPSTHCFQLVSILWQVGNDDGQKCRNESFQWNAS